MVQSRLLEDGTQVYLCVCTSVGCGRAEVVSQLSLADPPNVERGAWISRALYYRHQQLDGMLCDITLEECAQAIGNATIMRTLS